MGNQIEALRGSLCPKYRFWTDLLPVLGAILVENFSPPLEQIPRVKRNQRPICEAACLPRGDLDFLPLGGTRRLRNDDLLVPVERALQRRVALGIAILDLVTDDLAFIDTGPEWPRRRGFILSH